MDYLIAFLEGIITFISPCLLPMLPIYISYFAGQAEDNDKKRTLRNAVGFVLGFTLMFMLLGAFAGTVGSFLIRYKTAVNLVTGIIVILFGLNFMEVIRIPLINTNKQIQMKTTNTGFFPSMLFGIIFSIGWTPCVGVFLGSALMLAASSSESLKGIIMLFSFSMGLGIPFILSAVLMERLSSGFAIIKKHYRIITRISGIFLIMMGLLMATGRLGYYLSLLTF